MVAAANKEGYSGASVSAVIEQAGVSRPTFYEYFADRDDCFIATIADVRERLLERSREASRRRMPERRSPPRSRRSSRSRRQPAAARFLMKEALAAGPDALDARDAGIEQTAKLIEGRAGPAPPRCRCPTSGRGGARRDRAAARDAVAPRRTRARGAARAICSRGSRATTSRPASAAGARSKPSALPSARRSCRATALRAPPALGPGRPRMTEEEVAENHRQRIMFATSQVVAERGYTAATSLRSRAWPASTGASSIGCTPTSRRRSRRSTSSASST